MFANYDGVLKVDGEVGNKKVYDPRAWGKAAEAGMAARVVEACENLRSAGHVDRLRLVPLLPAERWSAHVPDSGNVAGPPLVSFARPERWSTHVADVLNVGGPPLRVRPSTGRLRPARRAG